MDRNSVLERLVQLSCLFSAVVCTLSFTGPLALPSTKPAFTSTSLRSAQVSLPVERRNNIIFFLPEEKRHELQTSTEFLLSSAFSSDVAVSTPNEALPLLYGWAADGSLVGARQAQSILDSLLQHNTKLSAKHFTIVMDAWGKAGDAKEAEAVYENLVHRYETTKNASLRPTRVTWNVLIHAQIRAGNIQRAELWLNQMENNIQPRTADYNALLGAYARFGQVVQAERLIKRMLDRCKSQEENSTLCICAPNISSYNHLIEAYAKSGRRGSGCRAEEILAALKQSSSRLHPDVRTYTAVIQTLGCDADHAVIERVHELYHEALCLGENDFVDKLQTACLHVYTEGSNPNPDKAEEILAAMEYMGTANLLAYNKVLKVWKVTNSPDAVPRAEQILTRMEDRNLADRISYTTFIGILSAKGDKDSAQRANDILNRMAKRYEIDRREAIKPNTQTLNAIILAWTRCGDALRAEQVLDMMEVYHAAGDNDLAPNVVSYSTLMDGWSKSNERNSLQRAEAVFNRMKEIYGRGHAPAKPNLVTYVTMINAYAKARDAQAAHKAQALLFQMYEEYKQGRNEVMPNAKITTAVIEAWQKSGLRDAGNHAEDLLEWLIQAYMEHKEPSLRPNEYSFATAISAWGKSRKVGKATRARHLLNRMKELYKAGVLLSPPNAHCYTAVRNSCAFCENDENEKQVSLSIAVSTYNELVNSASASPNHITFATLITAIRNLMPGGHDRDTAVQVVFKKAAQCGLVDDFLLNRVQTALSK